MNRFYRCLSLLLIFCLLGQNSFLAAQAISNDKAHYSLQQYQEFAKQEIQATSWLQQNKDILITAAGTTVTVGTLATVLMNYQKKKLQQASQTQMAQQIAAAEQRTRQAAQKEMAAALEKAEQEHLQRELAQQQEFRTKFDDLNKSWQKKVNDYKSFHNQTLQTAFDNAAESNLRVAALEKEVTALKKEKDFLIRGREKLVSQIKEQLRPAYRRNYLKANLLEDLLSDLKLDYTLANANFGIKELTPFLEAFSTPKLTLAQRKQIIEDMMSNPAIKKLGTEAQQQEFKLLLEQTAAVIESQTISTTGHVLSTRIASVRGKLSPQFLAGAHKLYLELFSKRNIFMLALVLGIGLSTTDIQAQNQVRRLNANFNLFLNATPEELAVLEKNPEAREACIMGVEALSTLSSMPQEEAEALLNLIPQDLYSPSKKMIRNLSTY